MPSSQRHAAILVIALVRTAHADEPDPAVIDAGEHNLESIERRRGFTFAVAVGGGLTFGVGHDPSVGRGGAASIRIGQVATRHTVLTFEIAGSALFHKVKATGMSEVHTNQASSLLAGAQYYVNGSLWLRGALGLGVYKGDDVLIDGGPRRDDITRLGPSAAAGAGLSLVQFRRTAIGVELFSQFLVNRDGVLSSNVLLFNFTVD
ncbi:MAG: hypothetical protein WKG01_18215 [Kofleriaceae bacterium]